MAAGGERAKDLLVSPPPKLSRDEIASQWPLHWYVWHDDVSSLEEELALNRHDKDKKDSRGRTALHLAVSLGYVDCVKALLCAGCDANAINNGGWNVSQEAISTGNPELVSLTLQHRDFQRGSQRLAGIPELLDDLNSTPDFYVEMKWEFTSWVPFMSRMCPSDTYKIYKKGANVRVDTTLIGFDQNDWQRGNRSYVFKGEDGGGVFLEIDHDRKAAWKETLKISKDPKNIESTRPSQEMVTQRMTSPIVATMLDTDSIAFTRHKCMWGWGGDRTETIGLFECKVYSATGVEVVTKTRVEHLADDDKKEAKVGPPVIPVGATGLQSLLGIEEEHSPNPLEEDNNGGVVDPNSTNPFHMGVEEYFNPSDKSYTRDIGRIKEMSTKKQKFKATISMADPHPLSLQQQVLPIIKLLAISNAHFAKLRDFVALHLPAGFPVKIEIPLFHVLSAKITFGNINGVENTVRGVTSHDTQPVAIEDISVSTSSDLPNKSSTSAATENDKSMNCCIETACFDVPAGYREIRVGEHLAPIRDEEDELLQLAIQQSLLEYGGFGQDEVSQALKESQREDEELQRAIRESLKMSGIEGNGESEMKIEATGQSPVRQTNHNNEENDEELQMAMVMSEQQMEQDEKLRQQEEDELRKAIELSMTEK